MKQYIDNKGNFWTGQSVVVDDVRYISPTEDILLAAGYTIYSPQELSEQELIDLAKTEKLSDIDDYNQSEQVNVFYLNNEPLWLNSQTRQQLRTSILAYADSGIEEVTKWFNEKQYTFATQTWLHLINAVEIYAAEALNVTERHKAEVSQLNNLEEIQNYDITNGYPEILVLTA